MEKYKYTGPTIYIGENGDIRLGTGQTVEAEVNINIAHVFRLVFENSGTQEVDIDIAAKYLEPVEPDTIHFDPKDEVKNFYNADDDSRVAELVGLHNKHDNDHEVGGNHYKMAIEPWDYIQANGLGFDEGNIVKYASRHKQKNGAEDIRKIISYAKHILKTQYGVD